MAQGAVPQRACRQSARPRAAWKQHFAEVFARPKPRTWTAQSLPRRPPRCCAVLEARWEFLRQHADGSSGLVPIAPEERGGMLESRRAGRSRAQVFRDGIVWRKCPDTGLLLLPAPLQDSVPERIAVCAP